MTRWIDETLYPHWGQRLRVGEVLFEDKTEHQHLVIFENASHGRVMVLDGAVQVTLADEFVYHEMMSHVPLFALAEPRRVLVIGGGDGGILRETLKHKSVEKAVLCEIDRTVVDMSLKYFPEVSAGAFNDRRTEVVIADGVKMVAETDERYDAILVDSTDPQGPARCSSPRVSMPIAGRCLNKGGVLVTQNGVPFLFPEHLRATTEIFLSLFKSASPFMCTQPCYFGGPFALNAASDGEDLLGVTVATLKSRMAKRMIDTRYYTPAGHLGAFALPGYVEKVVAEAAAGLGGGKGARKSKDRPPEAQVRPIPASAGILVLQLVFLLVILLV